MRVPNYYCPNCKRFKRFYQVTNIDAADFGYCKHCGTRCVETEEVLQEYIEKLLTGEIVYGPKKSI